MNRALIYILASAWFGVTTLAAVAAAAPREPQAMRKVPATDVTLRLKNATPFQVINSFSDKLGITLYVPGTSVAAFFHRVHVRRVTLTMSNVTFWHAMRRIYRATGISVYDPYVASQKGYPPGFRLTLRHPILRKGLPYSADGAFFSEMLPAKQEVVSFAKAARRQTVLRLAVMVQPPYWIFGYRRHCVQIKKLTDGRGHPLKIWKNATYFLPSSWAEPWCIKFGIPLTHAFSGRTTIGELRGYLRAYVLVSSRTVTIPLNGLRPTTKKFNHVRLRLLSWPRPGKGYGVFVVAEAADRQSPASSLDAWADVRAIQRAYGYRLWLYDHAGHRLLTSGGHSGPSFPGIASFYNFFPYPTGKDGKPRIRDVPCKAVMRLPLRVVRVNIPFDFRKIRLAQILTRHRPATAH